MPAYVVPTTYSVERAKAFLESVENLYVFVSDHRPGDSTIMDQSRSMVDSYYRPWNQMIEGKRVTDLSLGIRNVPYKYGKTFVQYDDRGFDPDSDHYAIVNAGSYSHAFKCLYNNGGAPSTVQPDFSQVVGANSTLYQTSDGYRWKYAFSVDSATVDRFATPSFFPFQANSIVESAAVGGSINTVNLQDGGKGYDNYTSGTLQASDVRVSSIPTLYQVSNGSIKTANGFYTGCVMVITAGTGAGQFALVNDYVSTPAGNYVNLSSVFSITPTNGSKFEISPACLIVADGTQSQNCVARALVNSLASNSVSSVEILNPGAGYFRANAAIVANAVVGVRASANARVVMPPPGGHCSNVAVELGATTVIVSAKLSNTEGGLIPATNSFRRIGLVNGPRFANVNLTLDGTSPFSTGEELILMRSYPMVQNATANVSSQVVSGDDSSLFLTQFSVGQTISLSNGSSVSLSTISTISNNDHLGLTSNSTIGGSVTLSRVDVVDRVVVTNAVSPANVYVSNVSGTTLNGLTAYGSLSGASGSVLSVTRNGVQKDQSTFVQLYKYRVTTLAGSFAQNERVLQGNSSGLVHSFVDGYLYVSNLTRPFLESGANLTGATSGTVATITEAYSPELIPGSGAMEYVENVEPVTRQPNENEQFITNYLF